MSTDELASRTGGMGTQMSCGVNGHLNQLIEAVINSTSEQAISELVNFLDSVSDSVISDVETEGSGKIAFETLDKIHQFISLPSLNQEVIDMLAFEFPKVVAKIGCVSQRCSEVTKNIIDRFVGHCSPRDMLSIFCEALASPSELFVIPCYFVPLLVGLAKVLVLIQRRHFEQVNAAVPVVLNVLKIFSSTSDYEDTDYEELFRAATDVASSIQAICVKLEGDNHKLHAFLGLFVLQLMALVSIGMRSKISKCTPLVIQLSELLHYCKLSYNGLITGCEVAKISKLVIVDDDGGDDISCFSHVKLGASLAVIWGYKNSEVAKSAKADLTAVKQKLQDHWNSRFEAIGMLKYIFSCADLPLELKRHAIEFLLCIMDGSAPHPYDDHLDYTTYMPAFYANLQAIGMVIMNASETISRRNAFTTFKKVLSDIPTSVRFDVLKTLIKSAGSSSMVAILLDIVKEEMRMGKTDRNSCIAFWNPSVLELVEMVLRPLKGGPPSLPEYSDAVLSALNFYRFILITESTGKSNYTGILSKGILQKAYNEWFLPLHTLVSFMEAENKRNRDHEFASDAICALNPVELVLYRCIELVEEELKNL